MRTYFAAAAIAAIGAALPCQRNVTLLGTFNPGHDSNDIWGYTDPGTGKEYALFMTERGTYVMDCSNGSPVQVTGGFISGTNSIWRDGKTYGSYAYIVTEGSGGMQIIDLTNPDMPSLAGPTWGTSEWRNCHNIALDTGTGIAYACGTDRGTVIIDVATNPTNPTRLGIYSATYVHDLHVQDGYAHLAALNRNDYVICDASTGGVLTEIGSRGTPGSRYFHNTWATRDNNYCVGTNETSGGPLSIWDIRNKTLPILVTQTHPAPSSAIIHNAIMRDRVVHVSYYTEGYIAFDLSNPAMPVVVAQYDTWGGSSRGYNGAWGVYPFNDSGRIYISDIQTGLYVLDTPATSAYYGDATAGGTATPEIHTFGAPYLGNANFKWEVEEAAPSAPGVMVLNSGRFNVNFLGLQLNVDPAGGSPLLVSINTDANGKASVPSPIPNIAFFNGRNLNAQFFVFDAGGPLNLSASKGAEIELFVP